MWYCRNVRFIVCGRDDFLFFLSPIPLYKVMHYAGRECVDPRFKNKIKRGEAIQLVYNSHGEVSGNGSIWAVITIFFSSPLYTIDCGSSDVL